jgi:hypothetical protein
VIGLVLFMRTQGRADQIRSIWKLIDNFAGPAGVTAFVLLILPLSRATPDNFYVGSRSLRMMVLSLAYPALFYRAELRIIPSMTEMYAWLLDGYSLAALRLFVFALLAVCVWMYLHRETASRPLAITAGTLLFTVITIFISHKAGGIPYPEGRTESYFLFLLPLAALLLGNWLLGRGRWLRRAGQVWTGVLAVIFCCELLQFETRFYYEWRYDADTKDFIRMVNAREAGSGRTIKFGGSWIYEPALNFYRVKDHYDWLEPVKRAEITSGYHYYFLCSEDKHFLETLHLRPIATGEFSGATLAVPQ